MKGGLELNLASILHITASQGIPQGETEAQRGREQPSSHRICGWVTVWTRVGLSPKPGRSAESQGHPSSHHTGPASVPSSLPSRSWFPHLQLDQVPSLKPASLVPGPLLLNIGSAAPGRMREIEQCQRLGRPPQGPALGLGQWEPHSEPVSSYDNCAPPGVLGDDVGSPGESPTHRMPSGGAQHFAPVPGAGTSG